MKRNVMAVHFEDISDSLLIDNVLSVFESTAREKKLLFLSLIDKGNKQGFLTFEENQLSDVFDFFIKASKNISKQFKCAVLSPCSMGSKVVNGKCVNTGPIFNPNGEILILKENNL